MSSRILLTLTAVLLVSSVLLTGVLSQDDPQEEEPNLIGSVIDIETGSPLAATVVVRGTEEQSWMYVFETDDEGMFSGKVPVGKIYVMVEAKGYLPFRTDYNMIEGEVVELVVPMEKQPVDEVLDPNVFGYVFDTNENPVHAFIVFFNDQTDGIKAETDRSGMFELRLKPGVYRWKASAEGYYPVDGTHEVPREGETRLTVRMKPMDIEKPPLGTIYGMVVNFEGEPLPGTHVTFMSIEPIPDPILDEAGKVLEVREMFFEVGTSDDGTFRIVLPLGIYMMEAYMEGYLPFSMDIAITPENPEAKAYIEMEWTGFEEPFSEPNIRLTMEMTDSNSDGNPEKLFIEAHVDEDQEPYLILEKVDENSDGIPESVKFHMDMPKDIIYYVMEMIMERMYMQGNIVPLPEIPYNDQDGNGIPDIDDIPGDMEIPPEPFDAAGDPDLPDSNKESDVNDLDSGSTISEKGSGSDDNGALPAMIGAIGLLIVIVTLVFLGGYIYRIRKRS